MGPRHAILSMGSARLPQSREVLPAADRMRNPVFEGEENRTVDEREAIRRLELDAKMFGITRTTTFRGSDLQEAFRGYRANKAGETVEITVEVLDAGDGAGADHYAVSAYSNDGKEAHGNEAATLEDAIPNVDWDALD